MTARGLGGACLIAAAFVSSWNAVTLGGVQPVDVFLALAAVFAALYLIGRRVPWIPFWIKVASLCIMVVAITHLVVPTSDTYMSQRFTYVPWFARITGQSLDENGAMRAVKWLLALAVLPVLIAEFARERPELVRKISNAWLAGATLSAFVAVTDLLQITSINTFLIVIGGASARQGGLTSHPNHLGLAVSMAAPIAIGLAMRARWKGTAIVLLLAAGAVVSGSRAGQAGFILAVAATLAISARARRFAPVMITAAGIAAAMLVWTKPGLVDTMATLFRFDSTDRYVAQSNEERANLSAQAVADFAHRPLDGVGFEVVAQAHNIYLQILASGGLVLALGMLVFFFGILRAGLAERNSEDPLAGYLLVAICVWLAAGTFGTQLTDRYLYFPVGAMAAIEAARYRSLREKRQKLRGLAASERASINDSPILSA